MLVGYEVIIANLALRASLSIYHLISNVHSRNKQIQCGEHYGVCMLMIGHCPWSIYSQYMYMQTHGRCHGRMSFFVSSNVAHGFENLKCKWRPWEMFSRGCCASKQKPRNRDRKRFWRLELSKLKKEIHKVSILCQGFKRLAL